MLKFYCSDCGGETMYSVNPPKFCSHCGLDPKTNLRVASQPPRPSIRPTKRPPVIEEYEDEEGEESYGDVPEYKASITFDVEPRNKGIDFRDLQNQQPIGLEPRGTNPLIAKQNDEQFLNDFSNSSKKSEISID